MLLPSWSGCLLRRPWGTFNSNYGYGWIIADQFNHRAQVHGGTADRFETFIMRFPEDKATIVFLCNLDVAPMEDIARSLPRLHSLRNTKCLNSQSPDRIRHHHDGRYETALNEYRHLRVPGAGHYEFSERELNSLGYDVLNRKRVKQAIEDFKLNVEAYPESFNVYDSLGEAYMVNSDKELAIKNYQKSVDLNPQNTYGLDMLKRLKQQ